MSAAAAGAAAAAVASLAGTAAMHLLVPGPQSLIDRCVCADARACKDCIDAKSAKPCRVSQDQLDKEKITVFGLCPTDKGGCGHPFAQHLSEKGPCLPGCRNRR